ncbi:MAG: hypothetical protein HY554_06715 [Elusimicrobia bacterium]|nr:hypothetical protein [Elusimicrobiota bacterium]
MPKKVLFESAVHQFVSAARAIARERAGEDPAAEAKWRAFLGSMRFTYPQQGVLGVAWEQPVKGRCEVSFREAAFYTRGDSKAFAEMQPESKTIAAEDPIQRKNEALFAEHVLRAARLAGIPAEKEGTP